MNKEMFISSSPHETKVAVCEDGQLVEVYFERDTDVGLVGGIYKGRVSRVLPGMQSAFVNIGLERDAFLYVSDFSLQDQEDFEGLLEESQTRVATLAVETLTDIASPVTSGEGALHQPSDAGRPLPGVEDSAPEPGERADEASAERPVAEAAGAEVPAVSEGTSYAPKPADEEVGYRHRSHRGRRRRRHGRRGPDDRRFTRPTTEPEPGGESPEPAAHRAFELLPGETLAKYGHFDSEVPSQQPVPQPTGEVSASETSVEPSVPETDTSKTEVRTSENLQSKKPTSADYTISEPEQADLEQSLDSEPAAPEPDLPLSFSTAEESRADTAEAAEEPAPGAGLASTPFESGPETAEEPRDLVEPSSEESAIGSTSGPVDTSSEPPETESGSEEPLPQPSESPVESPERTSTLREPHAHPRVSPRRGRRGRRRAGRHTRRQNGREPAYAGNQPGQGLQISELLKEGQEIIVQIAKEPLGTKGARITSHVALPGRYVVYMPTISHIGVSRKISSEQERLRLRNVILENKGPLTGGFIVRTAGEGRSEEEIKADLKFLTTLWDEIRNKAERVKAPALLYRDLDLAQRLMRDLVTADFKSIWLDNETDYERVVEFVNRLQPSLVGSVKLHTREASLFEEHGVQGEIEKALRPKVWLKSGGYIVINQTEALVAIDVNTGKYVGKTNRLEDTIVKTNIDAVNEIVRQIRLRDLGGIIVIDFIDMDERRNRNKVVQALEDALRRDRAPTKVLSFNDFGLVAVTRKRVKQSLERTLCDPCTYCSGSGWIKSASTVCNEILSEARKMSHTIEGKVITLRVSPEVAQALKSKDGTLIAEIEMLTHKDVIVKSDPTVHQERFEIF